MGGHGCKSTPCVDLDGDFTGIQQNLSRIIEIRKNVKMIVEVGGGIRNITTVDRLISAGINQVIIGTSAIEDPSFFMEACRQFPGQIFIGIDAKNGKVAVKGCEEVRAIDAIELAKRV